MLPEIRQKLFSDCELLKLLNSVGSVESFSVP